MTAGICVAILGATHGHSNLYVPALRKDSRVSRIVAVDKDLAAMLRRPLSANFEANYGDAEAMLRAESPDVVIVLGKHSEMAAYALSALDSGAHVVLEKPGGLRLESVEATRIVASERSSRVTVPFVQRMGGLAEALAYAGRIEHLSLQFHAGPIQRYRENGMDWILDDTFAGGGVLLNLGVHFIDLFLHLAGDDVLDVKGIRRFGDSSISVEDSVHLLLTTSTSTAAIQVSYNFPTPQRHVAITCHGSDAFVTVNARGDVEIATGSGVRRTSVDVNSDHYYAPWVRALLDAVVGKGIDPAVGRGSLATIDDLVAVRKVTDQLLPKM